MKLLNTLSPSIEINKGKNDVVFTSDGKKYFDLVSGVGCCISGHSNPIIASAVYKQSKELVSISNYFSSEKKTELAQVLSDISGLENIFLSNSGTEANECAIKLARKATGKKKIISMVNSFHGRTMGSLSATWKEKYKTPFAPLVPGFEFAEFDNIESLNSKIDLDTAAVILEPIQGEAGVITPKEGYLKEVKELCKKKNCLLIVDEVQSGNGRTGKYFAYEHEKIVPDIVTTAKGLANGFPIGATLSNENIYFEKGDHNSTFGGNSVCCAAALANIEIIKKQMPYAQEKAELLTMHFSKEEKKGKGLMIGLNVLDSAKFYSEAEKEGLLVNAPNSTTIRLLPPLTIPNSHCKLIAKKLLLAKEDSL